MQLHDILPPVQMMDYTFLYVLGLLSVGLFALIFKYFYKRYTQGTMYYLRILEHCDYQDAKKTAFQFSYYGKRIFTNEEEKAQFLKLQQALEKYKYIQHLTPLPSEVEKSIKQLLQQVKHHHA